MPAKNPLTQEQWRQKLLAVLPRWFLEDIDESVHASLLAGAAAVFRQCEADAYDHVNETFITRCTLEMLPAHAAERLVPDLGYVGTGLRQQVQRMWNRLNRSELEAAVNGFLVNDTATLEPTVTLIGHEIIPIDYGDDEENLLPPPGEEEGYGYAEQPNLFNVIINGINEQALSFMDRDAYADRDAFVGYSAEEATLNLAKLIAGALNFYKASGVRFRISKRI